MTWSPQQVDEKIAGTIDRLEELVDELRPMAIAAGEAKVRYEVAWAKAVLIARSERGPDGKKRTEIEVKALATVATEAELWARTSADTAFDTQRRVIGVVEAQADLLRSLSASRRSAP